MLVSTTNANNKYYQDLNQTNNRPPSIHINNVNKSVIGGNFSTLDSLEVTNYNKKNT